MKIVNKGFTLIEVMIVVAVIGILTAIAYPSYMSTVRKSNRTEAKATLNDVAQGLQRCYSVYGRFNNPACPVYKQLTQGSKAILSQDKNLYKITITPAVATDAAAPTTFTLTAEADKAPQLADTRCIQFSLDHAGRRTATSNDCW